MSKFEPQRNLTELTAGDFADMQGKIVWVSIVEVDSETDVTTQVHAEVVGRVTLVSRLHKYGDVHEYGIGFVGAHNDPFNVTLPNDSGRLVLIARDLNS